MNYARCQATISKNAGVIVWIFQIVLAFTCTIRDIGLRNVALIL